MELEDLLDKAHDALIAGDLAALDHIGTRIAELAGPGPSCHEADARRLRLKAERNARLLEAAARGVKAALGRLTEIASGPTLTTYDVHGRRAEVGQDGILALRRF
jgi:hypothetical protein